MISQEIPVCVYCLAPPTEGDPLTVEHFFPETWYPSDTPKDLEKWTIPVHKSCNHSKSKLDEEFFHLFAAGIPENNARYKEIKERHLRAYDFDSGRNFRDKNIRHKKGKIFLSRLFTTPRGKEKVMPVLQPNMPTPEGHYVAIKFDYPRLELFLKFIVRGLTYKTFNKRLIQDDVKIDVGFFEPKDILKSATQAFAGLRPTTIERGPGFRAAWYSIESNENFIILYEVCIWENYPFYAWVRRILPESA